VPLVSRPGILLLAGGGKRFKSKIDFHHPRFRFLAVVGALQHVGDLSRLGGAGGHFFIDNLLFRIHFIIVMIRWTGLAPWEFEFPFPGSLTSTFLAGVGALQYVGDLSGLGRAGGGRLRLQRPGLSHPHTLTPSHPHTITPSHSHTLTPSHPGARGGRFGRAGGGRLRLEKPGLFAATPWREAGPPYHHDDKVDSDQ